MHWGAGPQAGQAETGLIRALARFSDFFQEDRMMKKGREDVILNFIGSRF